VLGGGNGGQEWTSCHADCELQAQLNKYEFNFHFGRGRGNYCRMARTLDTGHWTLDVGLWTSDFGNGCFYWRFTDLRQRQKRRQRKSLRHIAHTTRRPRCAVKMREFIPIRLDSQWPHTPSRSSLTRALFPS